MNTIDKSPAAQADRSRFRQMRGVKRQLRLGNYDRPDRLSIAVDRLIAGNVPAPSLADDAALVDLLRPSSHADYRDRIAVQMPTSPIGNVYDPERRFTPARERLTRDEAELMAARWDAMNEGDRFE